MKAVPQKKASNNYKYNLSHNSCPSPDQSPSTSVFTTYNSISIQRKPACPCGGGCPRCKGAMQPKLKISQPGDIYEQEADRVAEQVVASQPLHAPHKEKAQVQRKTEIAPDASAAPVADNFVQNLGPGEPLDPTTRAFFEPRFGHNFSGVRVHTDARASESARAVNARAYTVGRDIVFEAGEYGAEIHNGQRLLAHELAHVMQQDSAQNTGMTAHEKGIQRQGVSSELSDAPIMSVPTTQTGLSEDEMRVLAWLRIHRAEIIAAEARFNVDRRAIAGAIAWEALENVRVVGIKAVGPGKVHVRTQAPPFGSEDTVAKQVEDAGYLPKQTLTDRIGALKTPSGAITYIGAIMAAFADEAARPHSDGWLGEDIRRRPEILTNAFQGKDLKTWKEHLDKKKPGETMKPGNTMDIWVQHHLAYLEDAVGKGFPAEVKENQPALQCVENSPGQQTSSQMPIVQALTTEPMPISITEKQIEQDDFLRYLAHHPKEALDSWRRLRPDEQVVVFTYMAMFYDIDFAKSFREEALRRPNPKQYIFITNVETPENLTSRGYRLRNNSKRVQYWVHPSGHEVWLATPSTETQQTSLPERPASAKINPDSEDYAYIRIKIRIMTAARYRFEDKARQLKSHIGKQDFQQQTNQLWDEYWKWDQDLNMLQQDIQELRKTTQYNTEEDGMLLNNQIDANLEKWEDLNRWRQNFFLELLRDLPPSMIESH